MSLVGSDGEGFQSKSMYWRHTGEWEERPYMQLTTTSLPSVCDSTPRLPRPTKYLRVKQEEEELRLNPGIV